MDAKGRYRQVAALHAANIDQGFLSTLGKPFLELVYRAIDEAPDSVLIVEERNGRILGFVAGGVGTGAIYRRLLRRPGRLALALAPSVFRLTRLRRIIEILHYGRSKADGGQWPKSELLSIAVASDARGQGVAESLYRRLTDTFHSRGAKEFRIVVGDDLAPAHRFYRRMGANLVGQIEVHAGGSSSVYVQKVPLQPKTPLGMAMKLFPP